MIRIVKPELLDSLPPNDPRAVRSRRDLRRVNAWMGHHNIMALALQKVLNGRAPGRILELGAGDGDFLLRVAQKLPAARPGGQTVAAGTKATLLDRQAKVSAETLAGFAALGWQADTVTADVFEWLPADSDLVIANLFLHHFKKARLTELLTLISQRAQVFVALEPRRSELSLFFSRLLWAIGCNDVTRQDAVTSVGAGFSGYELSEFWPDKENWFISEQSVGAFSQLFIAQRRNASNAPAHIPVAAKLPARP